MSEAMRASSKDGAVTTSAWVIPVMSSMNPSILPKSGRTNVLNSWFWDVPRISDLVSNILTSFACFYHHPENKRSFLADFACFRQISKNTRHLTLFSSLDFAMASITSEKVYFSSLDFSISPKVSENTTTTAAHHLPGTNPSTKSHSKNGPWN